MDEHGDPLADVVNQEPIVFMDCTQSEMAAAFGVGGVSGLGIGIAIGVAIGFVMFGLVIGLMLAVGITWLVMNWLKNVRQKYYLTWLAEQKFLIKFKLGLMASKNFVSVSQRYGKGARRG